MNEYHKINSIFKRDGNGKIIPSEFSKPEFEFLRSVDWLWTEKVDGTNIRVIWKDDTVTFAGRTDCASIPAKLANRLIELFPAEKFLNLTIHPDMCLYGEGYGAGIQKGGGNYSSIQDFVLFDVKIGDWWLRREDVEIIADDLKIQVVPVVNKGNLWSAARLANMGFQSHWGDFLAEGLVLTPEVPLRARSGERIIAKIKHRDFY